VYTFAVLSSEAVIRAGVESVRELGLSSLGIRALAQRLGVTPMALYRHVETAAALQAAVLGSVLGSVPPVPSEGSWVASATTWAAGARARLVAHPGVASHVLTQWFSLPSALDWIEGLLAAAERGGMTGGEGVAAANAVFTFVLMRVEAEESIRAAGTVQRKLPSGRAGARWPRIRANAAEYEVARFDRHFSYGLEALLLGIERRHHGDT
jgi:AcrR family transcriptional regulator